MFAQYFKFRNKPVQIVTWHLLIMMKNNCFVLILLSSRICETCMFLGEVITQSLASQKYWVIWLVCGVAPKQMFDFLWWNEGPYEERFENLPRPQLLHLGLAWIDQEQTEHWVVNLPQLLDPGVYLYSCIWIWEKLGSPWGTSHNVHHEEQARVARKTT